MNIESILKAEEEALEFIVRAKKLRELAKTNSRLYRVPKETGALRRQSMELTRALAVMRRP